MNRRHLLRTALVPLVPTAYLPQKAQADNYPSRPITLIIPYEAGGGIDATARALMLQMEKSLQQKMVLINKGGAGGAIGCEQVALAEPNGYTLLLTANASLDIVPVIRKAGYRAESFAPIGIVSRFPSYFVVTPSLGVNTMAEFITLAKAKPGTLNYASAGLGSTSNLNVESFLLAAGIKATHVPYKGGGQMQQALLANEVQFTATTGANLLPHVAAGKLKLLAISDAGLSSLAPTGTPAISQSLPGLKWFGWYGLFAPRATPAPVVAKVKNALAFALAQDDLRVAMTGTSSVPGAGEDVARLIQEGQAATRLVVERTGIKFD